MKVKKMSQLITCATSNNEPFTLPAVIYSFYSKFCAETLLYTDNPSQRIKSTYLFITTSKIETSKSIDYKVTALINFINKMLVTEYQPKIIILLADEFYTSIPPRSSDASSDEARKKSQQNYENFIQHYQNRFQEKLIWECSFSLWSDWKSGKFESRFLEIVKTLSTKIPEHLNLAVANNESNQQKSDRIIGFKDIEEIAVTQLMVETLGQINIFNIEAINPSLYYLRDFWNQLTGNVQSRYWRPFQLYQVTFSTSVKVVIDFRSLPYFFECDEEHKLVITRNAIFLDIPLNSPNQQSWTVYVNRIIDVLFDKEILPITKELIVKTIKKHHQIMSLSNDRPPYNYLAPEHLHLFTELMVQVSPNITHLKNRCSSTYVFAFSMVDALLEHRGYHSIECIKATVNFINQLAESDPQAKVILLIADELQALNAQAEFACSLAELRSQFHEKGAKWVERCKIYFDKIRCSYQISHWADWISGERAKRFQIISNRLNSTRSAHLELDTATRQTYLPHLEKYMSKFKAKIATNVIDANATSLTDLESPELKRVSPFFENYPIEETAVVQLVIETFGAINLFYPTKLNPTLYFLQDNWHLLTDSKPTYNWKPFQDFQVPCIKRTTAQGIPVAGFSQINEEGFSLAYGKDSMRLEMPIPSAGDIRNSWCTPFNDLITDVWKSFALNANETRRHQWYDRPLTEQNIKHLSLFWHLGGVLRTIYDKNVSTEDKTNMVRTIETSYPLAK